MPRGLAPRIIYFRQISNVYVQISRVIFFKFFGFFFLFFRNFIDSFTHKSSGFHCHPPIHILILVHTERHKHRPTQSQSETRTSPSPGQVSITGCGQDTHWRLSFLRQAGVHCWVERSAVGFFGSPPFHERDFSMRQICDQLQKKFGASSAFHQEAVAVG